MIKWSLASCFIGAVVAFFMIAPDCWSADRRRVQYDTVACPQYGQFTNGSSKGCISIREGHYVTVERESGSYAYVRTDGSVDHYWMPLEPVRWKKP